MSDAYSTLTVQRLRQLFKYDPETGVFTRLVSVKYNAKVGDIAGAKNSSGRLQIHIDGKSYKAHRLAWLYVHGAFPENDIDHIDGNPANNAIANLRDVTHAVNMQNRKVAHSNNKATGLLGVSRNASGFQARIRFDGKLRALGTFKTPEAAHNAYLAEKRRLHPGCSI